MMVKRKIFFGVAGMGVHGLIEKVWRWMKEELKKLPFVPKNQEVMCRELQKLWDRVDPREFRHYTE